jgi:hypothetical protein
MLVLWSRDKHSIDGLVIKQAAEIGVGLNIRNDTLDFIQSAGINVGNSNGLGIWGMQGGLENFGASSAGPDQCEPDAVVGSEDSARQH